MDSTNTKGNSDGHSSDEHERISEGSSENTTTTSPSSSIEPCRLSWFLVKNDADSAARHGDYCIIHAMDIINRDPNEVFLYTLVHYNLGQDTLTGKVLAAADEIHMVEADMQECLDMERQKPPAVLPYLLVQYRPAPDRLVHKVMHESDVTPVLLGQTKISCKDVFVKEGVKMCQGYVLTRSNSANNLDDELMKVKVKCYDAIRSSFGQVVSDNDEDATTEPQGNPWLLLQYSRSVSDCIYIITRYNDTQNLASNMYPGVQTYLTCGNVIYQALIVHKSHDRMDLMAAMNNIANSCLISIYPNIDDAEFRNAELVKYQDPNLHRRGAYVIGKISKADISRCRKVTKCIEKEVGVIYRLYNRFDHTVQKLEDVLRQLRLANATKSGSTAK